MDKKELIQNEMNKLVLLIQKIDNNLYPKNKLQYEEILLNLNNLIKNL